METSEGEVLGNVNPEEDSKGKGRHPLLKPNVPSPTPAKSVKLDVSGHDGYTFTTPKEGDVVAMELLLVFHSKEKVVNIKQPYNQKNIRSWFDDTMYFTNSLLTKSSNEERHTALFDYTDPIQKSIPFQIIRYNDKLIGHCALRPTQAAEDVEHATHGQKFVKLSFVLSSEHRHRGVMFAALKILFIIAADEFDIRLVYGVSSYGIGFEDLTRLLHRLMDWCEAKCGLRGDFGDTRLGIEQRDKTVEWRQATWWLWKISTGMMPSEEEQTQQPAQDQPSPESLSLGPNGTVSGGLQLIAPEPIPEAESLDPNDQFHPENVINDPSFRLCLC